MTEEERRRRYKNRILRYFLQGGSMNCDCREVLERLDALGFIELSSPGLTVENTYCTFNYGWIRWGDLVQLNVEMVPKTTISSSTGNVTLDIPKPMAETSSLSSDRTNASSIGEAIIYQNKIFKGIGAKTSGQSYWTSIIYIANELS